MPLAVDINLKGDHELVRILEQLPASVQKKAVRRALRDGTKFLAKQVKAAAPRDSGRMARRMKVRAVKRSRTRIGSRVMMPDRDKLGIPAKAKGYYPMSIEAGWKSRGGKKIPGTRFMRDTVDKHKQQVVDKFQKSLGPAIDHVVARWRQGK
ncbi:MAG: HK97 gp10 family phage protein [Acidimicrobiia bacterium]|nr:HK97 gp10 family phage protein [Acidimicrobiia bacterium]